MKTLLIFGLLAACLYYYHGPSEPPARMTDPSAQLASNRTATQQIVVAPVASYHERWKTGANAFTDLKTGPNAQSTFEPFAPSEQATWNQSSASSGYTITSGAGIRPH